MNRIPYFILPPAYSTCRVKVLYVEYAERGNEYGILFTYSLFCEYVYLEYENVSVSYTGYTRRNTIFILLWLRHRNA